MKGTIVSDTIGVITVIIILFIFFSQILPQVLELIVDLFSTTSAEAVSKQLASFITISGSSVYKIKINYIPSKYVTYNIFSVSRMITVSPNYKVAYGKKSSAKNPYAVPLDDFNFKDVNTFTIIKSIEEGESHYFIQAEKIK